MAFLNKEGVERLWAHIVSLVGGKVDKVDGMGLSANNYTTEDKEQLANVCTLVGNTSVSTQISEAISGIETPQSDWEQNDTTAKDYIKNRTHYETIGPGEIVTPFDNITISGFSASNDRYYRYYVYGGFEIAEGNNVSFTIDSTEYTGVFKRYGDDDSSYFLYFGNARLISPSNTNYEDTGETYCVQINYPYDTMNLEFAFYTTLEGTSHTISLSYQPIENIVMQLDEKYIPDNLKNQQPDWSQNDTSKGDYVKNRTHWVDQIREVITPETTITGESPVSYDYNKGLQTSDRNKQFTITWDGVDYDCTVQMKSGMSSYYYCGNGSLYSSSLADTGEPFCFYISMGVPKVYYATGTTHTYKIIGGYVDNVHQLDEKYIPDTIARADIVPNNPVMDIVASGQDFIYTKDDGTSAMISLITTGLKLQDRANGYSYMLEIYNGKLGMSCCCTSIFVTTMPTKTEYMIGDEFDPSGMVIAANCEDGSTKIITDYKYTRAVLTEFIEISYLEDGKTYKTSIQVSTTEFDAATVLVDFEYTSNEDGTYTITGWKGTLNGVESTECVIPNNALIIV